MRCTVVKGKTKNAVYRGHDTPLTPDIAIDTMIEVLNQSPAIPRWFLLYFVYRVYYMTVLQVHFDPTRTNSLGPEEQYNIAKNV